MASELEKIASEVTAEKKDISRSELSRLLGGRRFKLRSVSFSDLARGGAVRLTVEGVPTGNVFTRAEYEDNKEVFDILRNIKENHTLEGQKIITSSDKTADSRAVADVVSTAKKTQGVLDGLKREVARIMSEVRREGIEGVEESLRACLEEIQGAGEALGEAIYQGNKQMSDREMRWLR